MNRASADVGLMFIAYNLRRLINIFGLKQMKIQIDSIFYLHKSIILINPLRICNNKNFM